MKKALPAILFIITLLCFSSCGGEKKTVFLTDEKGTPFAEYNGTLELYDADYSAYARRLLNDAVLLISDAEELSLQEALDSMLKKEYTLYSPIDIKQIKALAEVYSSFDSNEGLPFDCAITDRDGRLTAIYSSIGDVRKTYAGSSIKPISVYAPCIEKGIMKWSDLQQDAPVKTLSDDSDSAEWPANGSGKYSYADITAAEALALSLNTVAVRWLSEYGAENAMDFLSDNFGIDLEKEYAIAAMSSADEILGNIALGYLQAGVDVCDMAGYYGIFSHEGRYTPAVTVTKITDKNGDELYTPEPEEKQVIGSDTAYIMNKMLKGVIDSGTGQAAAVAGVDIVGKTGTSDNNDDNWFIGVTPVNTVAVWHGKTDTVKTNRAAELFAEAVEKAGLKTDEKFRGCDTVQSRVYCPVSGKTIGDNCPGIALGYFKADDVLDTCDIH